MKKSIAIFGLFLMMVSLTSFTSPIGGKNETPKDTGGTTGGVGTSIPTGQIQSSNGTFAYIGQ